MIRPKDRVWVPRTNGSDTIGTVLGFAYGDIYITVVLDERNQDGKRLYKIVHIADLVLVAPFYPAGF